MFSNKNCRIGLFLTAIMLLNILFVVGTAYADDKNSSIFESVKIEKDSLRQNDFLSDFDTVTSNPKLFLEDLSDGKVELELLGEKFNLELYETYIVDENARVFVEDEAGVYTVPATQIKTYRGNVVGLKNSSAAITVSDEIVIGCIETNDNQYIIKSTNKTINDKTVIVVYSTKYLKESDDSKMEYSLVGDDVENKLSPEALQEYIDKASVGVKSITTITLLPAYDADFRDNEGSYSLAEAEIASLINNIEDAYSDAGVDFSITYYKRYGYLSDRTAHESLDDFESDCSPYRDITNSDLAILFYGKDFEEDVIGCSNGFSGSSYDAYCVVQMVGQWNYDATTNGRRVLVAHELGHNFAADHDEALSWNSNQDYSIMYSPWKGDSKMNLLFTDEDGVHGDANHDNIGIIQATKTTVSNFQ